MIIRLNLWLWWWTKNYFLGVPDVQSTQANTRCTLPYRSLNGLLFYAQKKKKNLYFSSLPLFWFLATPTVFNILKHSKDSENSGPSCYYFSHSYHSKLSEIFQFFWELWPIDFFLSQFFNSSLLSRSSTQKLATLKYSASYPDSCFQHYNFSDPIVAVFKNIQLCLKPCHDGSQWENPSKPLTFHLFQHLHINSTFSFQ